MIRYLIIDDEHIAHEVIKDYCDLLPNMELQKNCYDALEAADYLQKKEVDLIFLDLNMPKLKGFELLKTLTAPPKVIVTTAHKEYALEGYELNIVDYLLKPFSFERFLKAVNKAASSPAAAKSWNSGGDKKESIFLKSNNKYIQVSVVEILYVEASGNYTKVTTDKEVITIREQFSELLDQLPKDNFLRVHKSFAVALQHIHSIEGNHITIGKHTIPIGKVYKMNVNRLLK